MEQMSVFSSIGREEKLSKLGDNLELLNKLIVWEMFRPTLEKAVMKPSRGMGGRPRYDVVMMFKILVLARLYNLSDDQTEYQINDRISFMRFLGLGLGNTVPDAKTIWLFREMLKEAGVINSFNRLRGDYDRLQQRYASLDASFDRLAEENKSLKQVAADYDALCRGYGADRVEEQVRAIREREEEQKRQRRMQRQRHQVR